MASWTAPHILILYATREGQTARIATHIAEKLRLSSFTCDLHNAAETNPPPPTPSRQRYDGFLAGASVHIGSHEPEIIKYLKAHSKDVNSMPSGFFQVSGSSAHEDANVLASDAGAATRSHEADNGTATHATANRKKVEGWVGNLKTSTGMNPDITGYFAGAVAYSRYNWFLKAMTRIGFALSKEKVDFSKDTEYTDYAVVDKFAEDFMKIVKGRRDATLNETVRPGAKMAEEEIVV